MLLYKQGQLLFDQLAQPVQAFIHHIDESWKTAKDKQQNKSSKALDFHNLMLIKCIIFITKCYRSIHARIYKLIKVRINSILLLNYWKLNMVPGKQGKTQNGTLKLLGMGQMPCGAIIMSFILLFFNLLHNKTFF